MRLTIQRIEEFYSVSFGAGISAIIFYLENEAEE
jgi:hypothetical protein